MLRKGEKKRGGEGGSKRERDKGNIASKQLLNRDSNQNNNNCLLWEEG